MPETKKPMHPLNLPPTGTPGNGDSIKPKVFGIEPANNSQRVKNNASNVFHVIFISNSPLLVLQYRVYCNTNRRKMQNPSLFYISSRISPDRQYSAQSITRWLEDPLNSRDIS